MFAFCSTSFANDPGTPSSQIVINDVYYECLTSFSDGQLNLIASRVNQMPRGRLRMYSNGIIYMNELAKNSNVFSDALVINGDKILSITFDRTGKMMEVRLNDGDLPLGRIEKGAVLVFFRENKYPLIDMRKLPGISKLLMSESKHGDSH